MAIQDERHGRGRKHKHNKTARGSVSQSSVQLPIVRDDTGTGDSGKLKKTNKILPTKTDSKKEVSQKILFLSAVVVLSISVYVLLDYFMQGWDAMKQTKQLSSLYSSFAENHPDTEHSSSFLDSTTLQPRPLLPAAVELLKINPETAGWVQIPDTLLALPIVLRPSAEDGNVYYLTRDFNGQKKRSGAVFADYRTTIEDRKQSDNVVLYAHNESNDTMFGSLDKYKQTQNGVSARWTEAALEYYKEHPTFIFNTNYEESVYKIFAYFVTSAEPQYPEDEIFDYNNFIDFDMNRYNEFIENIEKRNRIVTDIDTEFGDRFVTLSTCSNEYEDARLVVIGRKVRAGESSKVDVSKVVYADDPLEPDLGIIYNRR